MEEIDVVNAEKVLDDPSIQTSLENDDIPQKKDIEEGIGRQLISRLTRSPYGRFSFRITK